ncbi:MAG: acetyl-CoA carboxylase biotin carboxyl carrier protein subunit [Rhodospirillales bacterium]
MADPTNCTELNVDLLRELAELLSEHNLTEIEYDSGTWRVRVARQTTLVQPLGTPSSAAAAVAGADDASEESALLAHPGLLASPMVGVVYTAPEPGGPPYVRVGDTVQTGDTVLLIEAMKVFNPISAPRGGRILRLFVSSGQPVEYGEPLLIIE